MSESKCSLLASRSCRALNPFHCMSSCKLYTHMDMQLLLLAFVLRLLLAGNVVLNSKFYPGHLGQHPK